MNNDDVNKLFDEIAKAQDASVKSFEEYVHKSSKDFDKYLFKNPRSIAAALGYKLQLVQQIENVYFVDWVRKK